MPQSDQVILHHSDPDPTTTCSFIDKLKQCPIHHPKILIVTARQGKNPRCQFWFHPRRLGVDVWQSSVIFRKYGVKTMKVLLVDQLDCQYICYWLYLTSWHSRIQEITSLWPLSCLSHPSFVIQPLGCQTILNFVSPVLLILMVGINLRLGSRWRQEMGSRILQELLSTVMHDVVLLLVTSAPSVHSKRSRNLSLSTPLQNTEH